MRVSKFTPLLTVAFAPTLRSAALATVCMCVWLALCPVTRATDFLIDVWDTEKGLPNSSVTAITQTPDGYLWVGTYNGLARFDGVHFEIFDPLKTPSLTHPRIHALFVDAEGVLWVNTYDGSLTSYRAGEFVLEHRGTGSLDVRFTLVSSTADEIAFSSQRGELLRRQAGETGWEIFRPELSPRPTFYFQDGQGQVWWHSGSQFRFGRLIDGELPLADDRSGLRTSQANCVTVDRDGRLWVGSEKGMAYWEEGQCRVLTPTNGESQVNVELILPVDSDTSWVWANQRLRQQVGRKWVGEVEEWKDLLGTAARRLMGAHLDREGGVWFNHYGNGLFHIDPEGEPIRLTVADGLPGNRVGAWFEDREGNIWVGADRGGLARLRPKMFQVVGPAQGLPTRAVASIAETSAGDIWMATFGGGVHEWSRGALSPVPLPPRLGRFVFSLCEVGPGVFWMSAGDEDLYVVDEDGFRQAPWGVHGVKALLQDSQGRLWAGWKDGVGYWSEQTQQATAMEQGFETAAVRALDEGDEGVVWFGSDDGSLYQYVDGDLQRFQPTDALSSQPIRALHAEDDGTVWAGTFRGGLLRFKGGRFTRYSVNEGLPSDVITQILDDGRGRLWCGSHQGVFHVNKTSLDEFARGERTRVDCVVYGRLDGLPSLECSGSYGPSCLRGVDCRLWFATAKGLVSIHPDAVDVGGVPPPVVIQELRIDGSKQVLPHRPSKAPSDRDYLDVSPGRTQIRFHYTALNLSSPGKVRFRHRLVGHDRDWLEVGSRREAIYSALPPGRYTFEVTACNSEGVWNEQSAMALIHLRAHFYKTWWFRGTLGISLLAGIIFTVRRVFTRRLRRELALAEQRHAIEQDRSRIAKDIHDDLGAGLTEISLLGELARRDTQENTPGYLDQISNSARGLVRAMDEIVWAVNPENDTLEGLMTYASKLAQDYLGVAGIRCRLDVPTHLPEVWLEAEVRHHIFLAIKESLTNIVKHSQATEAALRLTLAPGEFRIIIEDDGRGLNASSSREGAETQSQRLHSGHGLQNLVSRLKESGGRCEVVSEPGHGTRVELLIKTPALSPELVSDVFKAEG